MGELLEVDGKLPRTLRTLAWPPGELTAEWRRGRRASYIAPFRLYLATALVFFLAWPSTPMSSTVAGFTRGFVDSGGIEGINPADALADVELGSGVVVETLPALLLILFVPIAALGLRMVMPRGERFLVHLVTVLHIHAVAFISVTLTTPLALLPFGQIQEVVFLVLAAVVFAYAVAAASRIFSLSTVSALLRTTVVTGVYLAVVLVSIGGMLAIVLS